MIYAFRAGRRGPVKIGYAADPLRRVLDLRTSCPAEVVPLGVMAGELHDERQLHIRLRKHRIRGEWFRAHPEVMEVIKAMNSFPKKESFRGDRKQRRTTSERINPKSPAYRIVHEKGGGLSKFCQDFDFPTSTVQSWLERGLIPSRTRRDDELGHDVSYQTWIMRRGRQLTPPVDYVADDFIETEATI